MMTLLIRADASAQIGTGHVMRCLALAQAWQADGGAVTFLMGTVAPGLEHRLKSEGFAIAHHTKVLGSTEDSDRTVTLAQNLNAKVVVVDGYHFGSAYQQRLKQAGLKVLFVDDNGHADHYYADWVLNQNIYAHPTLYPHRESYAHLLLGTRYALLRKEFWPWRGWQREVNSHPHKILVTLGGSDPDNVTLKVIQALQSVDIERLDVVVVVGAANPNEETLQAASQSERHQIELRKNVSNMPELMAWADMAIAAGGSTCWELAFMALPSLMIAIADNQIENVEGLARLGAVQAFSQEHLQSKTALSRVVTDFLKIPSPSSRLVDGHGSGRVVNRLKQNRIQIRKVQPEDCKNLWHWANDPVVRAASFSADPIPLAEHKQWFAKKIEDPKCHIFIALDSQNTPIGQIRFDFINKNEAEIAISLDSQSRGQGFGRQLIELATQAFFRTTAAKTVHALIKSCNLPSINSFQKCGFAETTRDARVAKDVVRYSLTRSKRLTD